MELSVTRLGKMVDLIFQNSLRSNKKLSLGIQDIIVLMAACSLSPLDEDKLLTQQFSAKLTVKCTIIVIREIKEFILF